MQVRSIGWGCAAKSQRIGHRIGIPAAATRQYGTIEEIANRLIGSQIRYVPVNQPGYTRGAGIKEVVIRRSIVSNLIQTCAYFLQCNRPANPIWSAGIVQNVVVQGIPAC